jgi:hypothetical protein
MSNISLPNTIAGGQTMDPRPIQANFDEVERFINADVFLTDGTRPLSGNLTLPGPATAPAHAVQKAQLDTATATTTAAIAAAVATASADATTKKDEAIAAAATDATTKADTALASAKAYHDSNTGAAAAGVELKFVQDFVGTTRTTSTTAQSFLSTGNIVNTKAGYYIVSVSIDVSVLTLGGFGTAGTFTADLYVDGVVNSSAMIWAVSPNANVGHRVTLSKVWIISNPADTALFEVKVRQVGTDGSFKCDGANHSFIQALFVG